VTRKSKRLSVIGGGLAFLGIAAALVFHALGQRTSYFYMPAELAGAKVAAGQRIRLGGLVESGSVIRGQGTEIRFAVGDGEAIVNVAYNGILPDLFREEQGVVAEGVLRSDGSFRADTVLAKHDETYMPREVADSLKEKGVWRRNE